MGKRNLKTIEIIRPVFLEKGIGLSEAERIKNQSPQNKKIPDCVFKMCFR
jgi:hypothetical protein